MTYFSEAQWNLLSRGLYHINDEQNSRKFDILFYVMGPTEIHSYGIAYAFLCIREYILYTLYEGLSEQHVSYVSIMCYVHYNIIKK